MTRRDKWRDRRGLGAPRTSVTCALALHATCSRAKMGTLMDGASARLWLFGAADRQGELPGREASCGDRNLSLGGFGVPPAAASSRGCMPRS